MLTDLAPPRPKKAPVRAGFPFTDLATVHGPARRKLVRTWLLCLGVLLLLGYGAGACWLASLPPDIGAQLASEARLQSQYVSPTTPFL